MSQQIADYVNSEGIGSINAKLAFLSQWLVYDSWNKDGGKTIEEWDVFVDKRFKQCEFLESCQKWWRENGQGKLL